MFAKIDVVEILNISTGTVVFGSVIRVREGSSIVVKSQKEDDSPAFPRITESSASDLIRSHQACTFWG
jgi:hypothetical protein